MLKQLYFAAKNCTYGKIINIYILKIQEVFFLPVKAIIAALKSTKGTNVQWTLDLWINRIIITLWRNNPYTSGYMKYFYLENSRQDYEN